MHLSFLNTLTSLLIFTWEPFILRIHKKAFPYFYNMYEKINSKTNYISLRNLNKSVVLRTNFLCALSIFYKGLLMLTLSVKCLSI